MENDATLVLQWKHRAIYQDHIGECAWRHTFVSHHMYISLTQLHTMSQCRHNAAKVSILNLHHRPIRSTIQHQVTSALPSWSNLSDTGRTTRTQQFGSGCNSHARCSANADRCENQGAEVILTSLCQLTEPQNTTTEYVQLA